MGDSVVKKFSTYNFRLLGNWTMVHKGPLRDSYINFKIPYNPQILKKENRPVRLLNVE